MPEKQTKIDRLQCNLVTAAKVVDLHGEKYIPIFKRIDQELETAKSDGNFIARARKLAA